MGEIVNGVNMEDLQNENLRLLKEFIGVCEKYDIWYVLAYGTQLGAVRHKGLIPWDRDVDVSVRLPDIPKIRNAMNMELSSNSQYCARGVTKKYSASHDIIKSKKIKGAHLDIYPLIGAPKTVSEQTKFTCMTCFLRKLLKSKYVDINMCLPKNKKYVRVAKIIDFFISDSCIDKIYASIETRYPFESSDYLVPIANEGMARECIKKEIYEERIKTQFEDFEAYIPKNYDRYLTQMYGDYMTPVKY